ncbi:LOW QUALITY PROTEIN: hypothetical protein ColTof3_11560 [Colletotrichum tofieldiae]|nr:LOW QUALITY PROTEIN: hypothetical protein ColTof3_11560 [Colletotrichum tofieldiae]
MDFENATGPALEVDPTGADVRDGTSLVTVIWGINLTAFILVGLIVPLRVIVRCTVTRNFFNDDVLVIVAALFTFGICSLLPIVHGSAPQLFPASWFESLKLTSLSATDSGLGQHSWNIDADLLPENTKSLLQVGNAENVRWTVANTCLW